MGRKNHPAPPFACSQWPSTKILSDMGKEQRQSHKQRQIQLQYKQKKDSIPICLLRRTQRQISIVNQLIVLHSEDFAQKRVKN